MNKRWTAILLFMGWAAISLSSDTTTKAATDNPSNMGRRRPVPFEELKKEFSNPGSVYAPFIFWFWDEPLDSAKMAEMSRIMSAQGFNPGYAHARRSMVETPSLPDGEWLGDAWFTAFGAALKEAEAAGKYLGYCDEYWWPSFQANGRVLAAHPELRAQSLRWETYDVAGGAEIQVPASFFTVAVERAQPLPSEKDRKPVPAMGTWIWSPEGTETAHSCWFRKTFEIPSNDGVSRAVLKIAADNAYTLSLNGKKLGEGDDWHTLGVYDVTGLLAPGTNVIAVEARNESGAFGLLFGLAVRLDDGRTIQVGSDKTWRTSLDPAPGWERPECDAAGWTEAREIAAAAAEPWNLVTDRIEHDPALVRSRTLRTIGAGAPFVWRAPANGAWRVYAFTIFNHDGADGGKVNYIDERLAPAFIKIALEPYAQRLSGALGRSIPGDFIDNEGDYGWGLAWSATLDRRYHDRYGRDIRLWMPLMIDRDAEGIFARARWEWFDLVSDLYAETFQAVTDWHEKRGMSTTAHFWEEGIQPQVNAVGDHLKMLRTLTMPGQDCLGRKPLRVHDFKEVESVAEFQGARAATELLGAGGFEGTPWGTFNPAFLKQSANAVTAWGMSHVIPHGVFTTRKLAGNPWPPDWYSENPMFPYLHLWTDFVRRACAVNSAGRAVPDVLVYNPIESAWVQADADILDVEMWSFNENNPGGRRINEIDRNYAKAIDELTAARVEFLVGDRADLKRMTIADGKLRQGEFAFDTLVLPATDILTLEAAKKIVDFARAGGHVYALAGLPAASAEEGMDDPRMKELMNELSGRPTFASCRDASLKNFIEGARPGLISPIRFLAGAFPLLQHRRRIDGRDFYWLANNAEEAQSCELAVRGARGAASIWDCETGLIRPIASVETDEESRLSLVFKPFEGYWLVFDPRQPARSGPPESRPADEVVMEVAGPWIVSCDARIQPVLEFSMTPPGAFASGIEKPLEDWKSWGLEKFSGLLDYEKTVRLGRVDPMIMLDLGKVRHAAEVWINGRRCGERLWAPHVFSIGGALRPGDNKIRIRVANLVNNSYGEIAESGLLGPVRLVRNRQSSPQGRK